MKTFVELTRLEWNTEGVVESPVWVDSARAIAIIGIFDEDDKSYFTELFLTDGIGLYVKGKPVEVAHKLGIKLGGLREV